MAETLIDGVTGAPFPQKGNKATGAAIVEVAGGLSVDTADLLTEVTGQGILDAINADIPELPPKPLRTDVASFPDRTVFSVTGADTDDILAAVTGKRRLAFYGYLQTDIACVVTFLSNATAISPAISLAAGDMLYIGALNAELPELWTGVGEPLRLTKSTAATVKGFLLSKDV